MLSYIERIPLEWSGLIGPFNFPLSLALRSVAVALAMGNAVVLKALAHQGLRWAVGGLLLNTINSATQCSVELPPSGLSQRFRYCS